MSLLIDAATKHQAGELAEAAKLYNEYIEKNAESVEALSLFGLCMQGMGNLRHAETLFSKALSAVLTSKRGQTRDTKDALESTTHKTPSAKSSAWRKKLFVLDELPLSGR